MHLLSKGNRVEWSAIFFLFFLFFVNRFVSIQIARGHNQSIESIHNKQPIWIVLQRTWTIIIFIYVTIIRRHTSSRLQTDQSEFVLQPLRTNNWFKFDCTSHPFMRTPRLAYHGLWTNACLYNALFKSSVTNLAWSKRRHLQQQQQHNANGLC